MDKAWFHHCLTGVLGLSALRKSDLDAFAEAHPSQANIRFVLALKSRAGNTGTEDAPASGAFHLPDRAALFRQVTYGDVWPLASTAERPRKPASRPLPMVASGAARPETTPGTASRTLPVYEPPQVLTEEYADSDAREENTGDELAGLEERLLAGLAAESEEHDVRASDQSERHLPAPHRKPVMDRFDSALHPPAPSPAGEGFLNWLQHLKHAGPPNGHQVLPEWRDTVEHPQAPGLPDTEYPRGDEDKTPDPKDLKSDQKKRKKKKEARKLAKSSIRPSQEVASETLAALLARQGHIDQAITMYQRLILLVPEKKSIFAGQIAKLKRKDP